MERVFEFVGPKEVNPVVAEEACPIRDFGGWLKCWNRTRYLQEKEGLLHCGFNLELGRRPDGEFYTAQDRIAFYMAVADGWLKGDGAFRCHPERAQNTWREFRGERTVIRNIGPARRELAEKAFNVLSERFFEPLLRENLEVDQELRLRWQAEGGIFSEAIFARIQKFFAIDTFSSSRLVVANLHRGLREPTHQEKIVERFLVQLAVIILGWPLREKDSFGNPIGEEKLAEQSRIAAARPWAVMLLDALRKLYLLEKEIPYLDRDVRKVLRQIAMRSEIETGPFSSRKARTIQEAVYAGSPAALLLMRQDVAAQVQVQIDLEKKDRKAQKRKVAS